MLNGKTHCILGVGPSIVALVSSVTVIWAAFAGNLFGIIGRCMYMLINHQVPFPDIYTVTPIVCLQVSECTAKVYLILELGVVKPPSAYY